MTTPTEAARIHGCKETDCAWADYDTIVSSFGTVEYQSSVGDYQGDYLYLLRYGHERYGDAKWGVLTVGYGSCSGCDQAEACQSWEDVAQLVDQLREQIIWGTRDETLAYVTSDARRLEYYTDDEDARRHWYVCKAILEPLPALEEV